MLELKMPCKMSMQDSFHLNIQSQSKAIKQFMHKEKTIPVNPLISVATFSHYEWLACLLVCLSFRHYTFAKMC